MAETFLEAVGVFQYFGIQYLLVPMLVFVMVLGFLQRTKLISDKPDINAGVAFVMAFIIAVIPGFTDFIFFLLPFFVGLMIIVFGAAMLFMLMGAKTENLYNFFKNPGIVVVMLVLVIIVSFYAIGTVFGNALSPYGQGTAGNETTPGSVAFQRIFSPEVFGTIIFITVAAVGIYLMSMPMKK
jgi:hypothetical protein